jgi:hypothetical protein
MLSHIRIFFRGSLRHWKVAGIVYVIQLGLALTLGMQVYEVLESSIGRSLNLDRLLSGYDHTVITDFLKVHGSSITPLIGQLRWLLLVWLLFSVFLNGALLCGAVNPETPSIGRFWLGGSSYFIPFLAIALLTLLVAASWTAIIWIPAILHLQWALEYFNTEKVAVWAVVGLMICYLAGLAVWYVLTIAVRLEMIRRHATIRQAFLSAWGLLRKQRLTAFRLFLFFSIMQAFLWGLYWLMDAYVGMQSGPGIAFMFFTQQGVAYLRILLRAGLFQGVQQIGQAH